MQVTKYLVLPRQDVGRYICTIKTQVKDWAKAREHGVSNTVSLAVYVLVGDHLIVLLMVSFDSPRIVLSKDAICNIIKWRLAGLETMF